MNDSAIKPAELARSWMHSHEEDTSTAVVYRPATYPFPRSRGRSGFHLQPDGTLSTRGPGPADQTVTGEGTWKLSGRQLEIAARGQGPRVLHIESVDPDRLVIRKS